MTEKTFTINNMVRPCGIEVGVPFGDTDTREALKRAGARFRGTQKTWYLATADMAAVRRIARNLCKRGCRLAPSGQAAGNAPRDVATYAAWFALPLPLPVDLPATYTPETWGLERTDDADIAFTIEPAGVAADGRPAWLLTTVTLTTAGQTRYEELLALGRAAPASVPAPKDAPQGVPA